MVKYKLLLLLSLIPIQHKINCSYNQEDTTRSPQKIGLNFLAAVEGEAGFRPPDSMADVGPTQILVALNGIIRTFDKKTGKRDNIISSTPESFFKIKNPNYTSDPRVRYDHLSKRWFVLMMNVNGDGATGNLVLSVSDSSNITRSTKWKIYNIQTPSRQMPDYPTLGIDNNALYIGTNQFSSSGEFIDCLAIIIQKKSALNGPNLVTTTYHLPAYSGNNTIYTPQGVDNFNPNASKGYFVGVSSLEFGLLELIRVNNPASTNPTLEKLSLPVSPTAFPIDVPQKNTSATLDGIDDRLMCAHIRGSSLWTVHQIGVNSSGQADFNADRNGCRWYEIELSPDDSRFSAKLKQRGTLYDSSANASSYWMGSIMTNKAGDMALCCSKGGPREFTSAVAAGRKASDPINSIQPASKIFDSFTFYTGQRWGDYSYVSLDPDDDLTMWTIQMYCAGQRNWATRVAELKLP